MTDAHCHCRTGADRHFVCEPFGGEPGEGDMAFFGVHPWRTLDDAYGIDGELREVRAALERNPSAGVGEIGLDRLKTREMPKLMREVFESQLKLAFVLERPLVLHGASGLTDEDVRDCVSRGICKVNFATELRKAFTDACRKLAAEDEKAFDPKAFGKVGMEAVTQLVMNRMKVCGCDGKA